MPERAAQAILAARQRAGDFDPALALLDSTVVRAHQHAAGAQKKSDAAQPALGRSRGGLSTKIHLVAADSAHGAGHEPKRGASQRRAPRRATGR